MIKKINRTFFITLTGVAIIFIFLATTKSDIYRQIAQSQRLINDVYKNIVTYYVDEINIEGQAKVFIKQSASSSVKIKIDSNLLPYIITEVSGTKLKIYEKKCLEEITEYKIYIYTPNITKLYVDGSIELKCIGKIKTEKLFVKAEGSGEIKLNLESMLLLL